MAFFDLSIDELYQYKGSSTEPSEILTVFGLTL